MIKEPMPFKNGSHLQQSTEGQRNIIIISEQRQFSMLRESESFMIAGESGVDNGIKNIRSKNKIAVPRLKLGGRESSTIIQPTSISVKVSPKGD